MPNDGGLREAYRTDGFLVLRDVLDHSFLDNLRAAILRPLTFLKHDRVGGGPLETDDEAALQTSLLELKATDEPAYLNALKLSQNDPSVLAAANNPAVIGALKGAGVRHPVVSLKPFPILVAEELFIEGGYNLRPAHQEWPVMQGSHNGVVVWFPLHDLEDGHSSLEVFPGSHLNGILEYEVSRCGSRITDKRLKEPLLLSVSKGDLVIFSAFTAHRSAEGASKIRIAMSLRYNDMSEPSYIKRGFPDNTRTQITRDPIDDMVHYFEELPDS
ncbi:MAG: phytanoyl-CoA dioxygenase family protein [Pseudomonadota bacterium]